MNHYAGTNGTCYFCRHKWSKRQMTEVYWGGVYRLWCPACVGKINAGATTAADVRSSVTQKARERGKGASQ